MLAAAGGVAGLQIAVWTTSVLRAYFGVGAAGSLNLDLSLDPRIALMGFGVALFTGVATGIAPALQSTQPDMSLAMKEGTPGAGRPRPRLNGSRRPHLGGHGSPMWSLVVPQGLVHVLPPIPGGEQQPGVTASV